MTPQKCYSYIEMFRRNVNISGFSLQFSAPEKFPKDPKLKIISRDQGLNKEVRFAFYG